MKFKKIILLSILTFVIIIICLGYAFYGNAAQYRQVGENESGEFFASLGFICLAIAYGRTMLKLAVNKGHVLERLEPLKTGGKIKTIYGFLMKFMNKTHPYVGAVAIISIFIHCYLTANFLNNFLLILVLVILAWQGIFGFIIKISFMPNKLRRKSYLIHMQFYTGVLILIFAVIGHLMIGY